MEKDKPMVLLHCGCAQASLRAAGTSAEAATLMPETPEEFSKYRLPQNQDWGKYPWQEVTIEGGVICQETSAHSVVWYITHPK